MNINEYLWVFGSLFVVTAVGCVWVNTHWPDTIPESFIIAIGFLAVVVSVAGFAHGVIAFGQWIINLFK